MRTIVPASQRALAPPGRALSPTLRPLLASSFTSVLKALLRVFPHAQCTDRDNTHGGDNQLFEEDLYSDEDNEEGSASIYEVQPAASPKSQLSSSAMHRPFLHFSRQPTAYRPRLLLAGSPGSGQSSHLAPALLHHLDKLPVHRLDLPTLYSISAKTPEESCAQVFREACRSVPSVVFMPHISEWWETVSDTVKSTFLTLLQDVPSFSPVLILATAETHYSQLSDEVKTMFQRTYGEVVTLCPPGEEDRRKFFSDLLLVQAARPPPPQYKKTVLPYRCEEVLPVAEAPGPRVLSAEEQRRLAEQEENTLRELRLFLRDVTKRLATDKRFNIFSKPVDIEEVKDYLEVIQQPMDLSTVMTKIDKHQYLTVKDFLADIDLICSNALEYNPDKDPGDKVIRHRACSLKDTAHAIFASELDPEFDRMCEEIKEARKKGGKIVVLIRAGKLGKNVLKPSLNVFSVLVGTVGPSDSCLTQDEESSCDTMGSQPNGHHPHVPSTEEESSNEPPVAAPTKPSDANKATEEPTPKVEGPAAKEAESENTEKPTELHCLDDEPKADGDGQAKQADFQPLIETSESSDTEAQPKHIEGLLVSQVDKPSMLLVPPLQALLDVVVKKSEGYSVEQLERLYSLLSQCIYQHRREYDKTHLLEVSQKHALGYLSSSSLNSRSKKETQEVKLNHIAGSSYQKCVK
uniref:ATPase family AAA domain containing 2B n=1 Tax=Sphaeramia orbicularis TaxID=375764 RepID=A0A673BCZ6_9TELE